MTLRTRLFLIVGGLVSLLVGAEWALVTALTEDLENETGSFALQVGGGVVQSLLGEDTTTFTLKEEAGRLEPDEGAPANAARSEVRAVVFAPSARAARPGEAAPPARPGAPERVVRRFESRRILHDPEPHPDHAGQHLRIVVDSMVHDVQREVTVIHEGQPRAETHVAGEWVDAGRERRRNQPFIAIELATSGGVHALGEHTDLDLRGLLGLQELADIEDVDMNVFLNDWGKGAFVVTNDGGRLRWDSGFSETDAPRDAGDAPEPPDAAGAPGTAVPASGPIAHTVPIPRAGFQDAVAGFLQRLWLGTVAIFGLGLLVAGWVAHRVSVPLRRLSHAATEVGEGALGTQVPTEGDREVSATLAAFNRMSTRLRDLDDEARALREREHLTEIGEVARGMAHAMRNPLHLLGLSVDQLAARCAGAGPEADELAVTARGQIQRVDRSLRTFLSLSSGAGGAAEPVRVDDLVRDVALELLQDGAATPVRVLADAGDHAAIRAVAPELRAVLHVLVVNAVEASSANGEDGGEVVVRVQARGDRALADGVRVEVEDEGPGLAPEVRAKLFTPHLTTKEQGAGMGLFLAHRIATSRYRGTLRLDPREPRGTRAVLVLHDRNGDIHHG